jgi:hypothetical protein
MDREIKRSAPIPIPGVFVKLGYPQDTAKIPTSSVSEIKVTSSSSTHNHEGAGSR